MTKTFKTYSEFCKFRAKLEEDGIQYTSHCNMLKSDYWIEYQEPPSHAVK